MTHNNKLNHPSIDYGRLADTTGSATSLFLVAKYDNRSVVIRRNSDYAATISSVRNAFPTLASLRSSQIRLSARFNEFGGEAIEINNELWADVLSGLMAVQVLTVDDHGECFKVPQTMIQEKSTLAPDEQPAQNAGKPTPGPMLVCIRDENGHFADILLPLFWTSTVRQLKDIISRHDYRLPKNMILHIQGCTGLEDHKSLLECGIQDRSIISVLTQFEVYLDGAGLSKVPMRITTFATVSVLKLLAHSYGQNQGIQPTPRRQVLVCAGEVLSDRRKLGSYSQIAPGCTILVNPGLVSEQLNSDYDQTTLAIRSDLDLATGSFENLLCPVFPWSSIHELKILGANKIKTPPNWLSLMKSPGEVLRDSDTIQSSALKSDSDIRLTTYPDAAHSQTELVHYI